MADFFKKLEETVVKTVNKVIGQTITYNLIPEAEVLTIKGVFSNSHVEVNGVSTTSPVVRIDGRDLSRKPSIKDTLVIDTVSYRIFDVQSESFGSYTLLIKKQ